MLAAKPLRMTCWLLILPIALIGRVAAQDNAERTEAASQLDALVTQYEQEGGARLFAKQFLALAETHPEDPAAVDALLWVIKNVPGRSETTQALQHLSQRHLDNPKLATAGPLIIAARTLAAESLLREALENSSLRDVRAHACYYLATLWETEASIVEQLRAEPELAPRLLQFYGPDYGKHLASLTPEVLEQQRTAIYERMQQQFADVAFQDTTLGSVAQQRLFKMNHLSVGKPAPEIEGQDIYGQPMKLSDYRGKVVMLTFWGHW